MTNLWKITIISGLVLLLVLVRMFKNVLFFDPGMDFFQNIQQYYNQSKSIPGKLYFNVFLRFWLNSLISLAILFVAFQKWGIVKFAAVLYLVLFVILFPLFIYFMNNIDLEDYLPLFYVRRFLIHPLFILILLPAFYYYRLKKRNSDN